MANNFALRNNLEDLWVSISTKHISYLCEDKSPEKLKYQNLLQNYIKEFLSIAPHRHKFVFPKTGEILQRSVASAKFNALKAASAWLSLSTYANNLYNQPWRKEYHEIKLYSGFYKHQIENCLSGAEAMLELMGYKRVSGDKMILEGTVNVQQLALTSLDSLVAMCECQVLFSVFKEISKHVVAITWTDVLRVRELYTGSPADMIRAILSLYETYPVSEYCVDRFYDQPAAAATAVAPRYPPSTSGCRKCQLTAPSSASGYAVNGYRASGYHQLPAAAAAATAAASNVGGCSCGAGATLRYADHMPFANGHYHPPHNHQHQHQHQHHSHHHLRHQVPTGKLIDLDELDAVYRPSAVATASRRLGGRTSDRWTATTDDDFGCRYADDPRLPPPSSASGDSVCCGDGGGGEDDDDRLNDGSGGSVGGWRARGGARPSIERGVAANGGGGASVGAARKYETSGGAPDASHQRATTARGAANDDDDDDAPSSPTAAPGVKATATERGAAAGGAATAARTRSSTPPSSLAAPAGWRGADAVESVQSTWECSKCTYYNRLASDVCEMCGKSRNVSSEAPLISGGKHCNHCTLVNKKEATVCEACDNSLEGSPTYV